MAGLRSGEIEMANAAFTFALWLNNRVDELAGGTVEVWAGCLEQRCGDASARRRRSLPKRTASCSAIAKSAVGKLVELCEGFNFVNMNLIWFGLVCKLQCLKVRYIETTMQFGHSQIC
jgi:hypothetical protein